MSRNPASRYVVLWRTGGYARFIWYAIGVDGDGQPLTLSKASALRRTVTRMGYYAILVKAADFARHGVPKTYEPERYYSNPDKRTRTVGQSGGVHIDIDSHNRNPGKGTDYEFFGAFASKRDALKREREIGGFIVPRRIGGKLRHVVLRRYRANPEIFIAGNPGKLLGRAVQLRYLHETEGPRYHDFDDGETRVEVLPDRSVRLYNPSAPLWMDDGT